MPEQVKQCSKCKLAGQEFYANAKLKDGLDTVCKSCRKSYQEANKDKLRERSKRHEAKRSARRKAKYIHRDITKEEVRQIFGRSERFAAANGYPQLGDQLYNKMIDRALRGQYMNYGYGLVDVLRDLGGRINPCDEEAKEHENFRRSEAFDYTQIEDLRGFFGEDNKDFDRLFSEAIQRIKDSPELDPRTKIILQLRYRYGLSQEEVAELFELTASRISQFETAGLAFIRKRWKER